MNQDLIVFGIVGAAALYLVRHLWQMGQSKSGCGSCKSCPQNQKSATQEVELVQIDLGGSWKR